MGGQVSGIPSVGTVSPRAATVHPAQSKPALKRSAGGPSTATKTAVPKSRYVSQSLRMASILYQGSVLGMVSGPYTAGELGFPRQKKKEELGATAPTGAGTIA